MSAAPRLPRLYHFTCEHTLARIGPIATLLPVARLLPATGAMGDLSPLAEFVWLTDLPDPPAAALGLGSPRLVDCDRMQHRYVVTNPPPSTRSWRMARLSLPAALRRAVEATPASQPLHWWVCPDPTPATLSPRPPRR